MVLLLALLGGAAPAAGAWTRGKGVVTVTVDSSSFAYAAQLQQSSSAGDEQSCALSGGGVALRCDGVLYTTEKGGAGEPLTLSSAPKEASGADALGSFDSISAAWKGGASAACALSTEIRYYASTESFSFLANFSESGVPGVNSTALLQPAASGAQLRAARPPKGPAGPIDDPGLATAFPTWPTAAANSAECEYYSYQGNSLGANWRAGPLSSWTGGLQAGPLLLFPGGSTDARPHSMIISPLTHAKAMIGSPGTKAAPGVSFGVQGYVEALPPAFSQAVVLLGRKGISATQMAWGETVRRHAGTKRLTLDKDILNSKVTYWTDNASARPPFLLPMPSILKVLCNF